ncbi:MAG: hypothetical protein QXL06_01830 [Nitrososphaerota archaeon]
MKRILWISRHQPVERQKQELKRIFGDCEILQYRNMVRDADHVVELMTKSGADEIVTVLPMSIIMRLVEEKGIKPIYAVMETTEPEDADYIDHGSGRAYKFKKFVRIKEFKIVTEEL